MSSGITLSDGSVIDSETVSVLSGGAGTSLSTISNSNQLTSLTAEQIAGLIAQINGLISTQTLSVISTQSLITMLTTSIETPVYGLRAIHQSTIQSYSSAVINYNTKLGLIDSASGRLSTLYSTLSAAVIQEALDRSTMNGYAGEYSSFLLRIDTNSQELDRQIGLYNSLSSSKGSYTIEYLEKATLLQSETNPTTMSSLSTIMGNNTRNMNTYSTFIQSTLYNISTMSFVSTSYTEQSNSYTTDPLYLSIYNKLFDANTGLLQQQTRIRDAITDYENQLYWLNQSTTTEYSRLETEVGTFFSKKRTQIQNQIRKIRYSVEEWESFIQYVTAQLALEKLQINNSLDLLRYQQASDPTKATQIAKQEGDQQKMQTIIDGLNPAISKVDSIYQNIDSELILRSTFIGNKHALTRMEIKVFSSPTLKESYRAAYVPLNTALGQNMADIVAKQGARTALIQAPNNSLMSIFNSQWTNIQTLGDYISFIQPEPIYPTGSIVAEVPFNSNPTEFNVLTPLNYN